MAKKIYDIKPPKISKEIKEPVSVDLPVKKKSKVVKEKKQNLRKFRFPLKKFLAGAGILLFVLFGFLYFKLQKVDVKIWPKTELLSFKEKVSSDKQVLLIDFEKNIIPAKVFQEKKEGSESFSSTGQTKNKTKAAGKITVYNKYSPAAPITLKAGTHFLSDSGKYFLSLQKIIIPGAKTVNGKLTAGSITVDIQAEEAGEEYNIKPAKFSVPKLVGTPFYYSIYGESTNNISGGSSKTVSQVTAEDIQEAKESLTKKIMQEAEKSLKEKSAADGYIILDGALLKEVVNTSSSVKPETVVDSFDYKASVEVTAVAFKKTDAEKFARDYIFSKMQTSKTLLEKSFIVNYALESVNVDTGKMSIGLDFSANIYNEIDENDLISLFREKNKKEVLSLIDSKLKGQTNNVVVDFKPFWTTKVPTDKNKIKLDLIFE